MNNNLNPLDNYLQKEENLVISNPSKLYLAEIGKWSKLLAIVGFVSVGLMLLLALFFGMFMSMIPGSTETELPIPSFLYSLFNMLLALIYYFPSMYLYKFSKNIPIALNSKNNDMLESALVNLKSFFKFIGVFTVITIISYALIILGAILMAAAFS